METKWLARGEGIERRSCVRTGLVVESVCYAMRNLLQLYYERMPHGPSSSSSSLSCLPIVRLPSKFAKRYASALLFLNELALPCASPATHPSLLRLTSQLCVLAMLTSIVVIWSLRKSRSDSADLSDFCAVLSFEERSEMASSKG